MEFFCYAYGRLSKEDLDKKAESDSIKNQRDLIHAYIDRDPELHLVMEGYDDGYTGTSFDRPHVREMLEAVKSGKVNCVVVKDLSRFGREYIESGQYIEKLFPELGGRFIAINDNYDTAHLDSSSSLMLPFRNLMNDSYCRDTSIKIRSHLDVKRRNGEFIGSFAVYGYAKDPENKNQLLPDPETAPVVRRIYSMVVSGVSFRSISRTLSAEGILTPAAVKGVIPRKETTRPTDWSPVTVASIIRNPVYLGKLVYGRSHKVSYKSKKVVATNEDHYIVTEGTHEAIVSQNVWDLANEVARRHKKVSGTGDVNIFSGLVFCQDCGSSMNLSRNAYVCYRYRNFSTSENGCSSHRIPYKLLYASVLGSVQEVTAEARRDRDGLIAKLSGIGQKKQQAALAAARKDQGKTEKRLAEIGELIRKAFEKNVLGDLPDDVYKSLADGYTRERAELAAHLETVTEQIAELTKEADNATQFVELAEQYVDVKELDRDLLHRLIDRIEIGESYKEDGARCQKITIYFRFVGKL